MPLKLVFKDSAYEKSKCSLCGSDKYELLVVSEKTNYVKCKACGLVYLTPRLKEDSIKVYYSQTGFYSEYSDGTGYQIQERALRNTFKAFLKHLRNQKLTAGKLLEIGCGYGYLLDEARDYFEFRVGTDYSLEAVEHARKYADHVYCGGLDALPKDMNTFDVIIAFAVLEHVYNPHEFLDEIKSKMAPNARLIIATPDIGNFWYKSLKSKWPFFIPPEHVCLYDNSTLRKLYLKSGFKDIRVFSLEHSWPVTVILSKIGLKITNKSCISNLPISVPKVIVCACGSI